VNEVVVVGIFAKKIIGAAAVSLAKQQKYRGKRREGRLTSEEKERMKRSKRIILFHR
jgi:hypothetical protein